jgi:hypothetical protein
MMSNNFDGWKHISTAPKDREVLVWDGRNRLVAVLTEFGWFAHRSVCYPTHWRGCPPPPYQSLPEDDE